MASNYWGIPRSTHDLDFVVELPTSVVLGASHAPHQFNAIDTRSALKVDFWLAQATPFDQEMFRRRFGCTLFGEMAWIATAEDVILSKLVWNSLTPSGRQLVDAAGVVRVQGSQLDESYLRGWAEQLGVMPGLNDLLAGRIRPKKT